MRTLLLPVVVISLVGHTAAQSYVVSPAQYTRYEAAASNEGPFASVARYQQIHGDLRGTPRMFTALAWRRDAVVATNQSFVGRTFDIEIACGSANYAALSSTFANNYIGAPTTVFTRKSVNGPDLTQQPVSIPAPWFLSIVFDTPFVHAGTNDVLYDIKVHGNTSGNPYPYDAVSSRDTAMWGASTAVGLGCLTAHGNMRLRSAFLTNGGTNTVGLNWSVTNGPTNAFGALLIGATNPNLFVPNLCPPGNYLYTDVAYMTRPGGTDSLGSWVLPTVTVAGNPAYAGIQLTSQAAMIDLNQGGLNVAVSSGITSEVAPVPQPFQLARVSATSPTALTGTLQTGYGLITRFEY